MEKFTYSIETFVGAHILNAGETDSIVEAYRCFSEKLELIECGAIDSVVIFEYDDLGLPSIIAIVNSSDC